jgi:ribosomal protein S18 acetylase RimI-like enzyme
MEIRELTEKDIEEAMKLVREVFMEFEAPEYEERGVKEFLSYIESMAMLQRMKSGEIRLWGSFEKDSIIGVISLRTGGHISLLFVNKQYHRRGIARSLFEKVKEECAKEGIKEITVNSSPYAQEAYRRLGFTVLEGEKTLNGIRFIPMIYREAEFKKQ